MWQRFTERARRAVYFAQEEASRLGEWYVNTEHLLLGLLREDDTVATLSLKQMGVSLPQLRQSVQSCCVGGRVKRSRTMKLTRESKRVVDLAYREAGGLENDFIGTEHLLLALFREGKSPASRVLAELHLDDDQLRQTVKLLREQQDPAARTEVSDSGSFSLEGTDMWQRFTERARRVVFFAQEEAGKLGENYVSTEHLLLGLVREDDSVSAKVLQRLNVSLAKVRSEVERQVDRGDGRLGADMQLTPRAKRVIDLAYDEARSLNNDYIGTEHLLLGMIREGEGLAGKILAGLGVEHTRARSIVIEIQKSKGAAAPAAGKQAVSLRGKDLVAIADLSQEELTAIFEMTRKLKTSEIKPADQRRMLEGKTLAMIFEKPSLRTRVSFEVGMFQLGGHALYLQPTDIQLGKRETIADGARNLERMVDIIMARVFAHSTIAELAQFARIPVINGLCDLEHPCQALADFYTILEVKGKFEGLKLAFLGDGNNVAHSLMLLAAKVGTSFTIGCPEGYEPKLEIVAQARAAAQHTGAEVKVTHDAFAAAKDADVVVTDVWASMGQEDEAAERAKIFQPFQVNSVLMQHAKPDAIFMHCLPAHRGQEVTDEVIDSPQSVVFDEAENRLHAQKAVMVLLAS